MSDARSELLQFIIDNVPVLIAYIDRGHRYVFVNSAYEAWFQRKRSEIVGSHMSEIVGEEAYQGFRPELETVLTGEAVSCDREVRYCTGTRWIHADYLPDRGPKGDVQGAVGVIVDITKAKQGEATLTESKNSLAEQVSKRTQRLTEVDRELGSFTYSASHDLRAPLRKIDSFSQMVVEHCGQRLDAECRRHLDQVREATRHMHRLIADMLDLAGVTQKPLEVQEIDLSALAVEIVGELRETAPAREAEIRISPGLRIKGDPGLWRAALWSLLDNAWKFTKEKDLARIEFGAEEIGGKKVYVLRDNGAGFDPRRSKRMFDAFERLHRPEQFPGTGTGLAIARRAIERQGGRIWARGEVGKGAAFFFELK